MKDILVSILGIYEPVSYGDGIIPSGLAGVDWAYVGGVILLCISVYSVFRLIGALLK